MASYNDTLRVKLIGDGTQVSLSIRESEMKVSTYIIPRKDLERMIGEYTGLANNTPMPQEKAEPVEKPQE